MFDDGLVEDYGAATWRYWQEVDNGDFPPPPVPGENVAEPIPVIARVVWETDGEEHIECNAIRWTRTHVLVDLSLTGGARPSAPDCAPRTSGDADMLAATPA